MEFDDPIQRKAKRIKRRNFVAKNNRHRGKRHTASNQYTRKLKQPFRYALESDTEQP